MISGVLLGNVVSFYDHTIYDICIYIYIHIFMDIHLIIYGSHVTFICVYIYIYRSMRAYFVYIYT